MLFVMLFECTGSDVLVKLLLEAGGDPNAADHDGVTPLTMATDKRYTEHEPRPEDLTEAQRVTVAMGVPLKVEKHFESLEELQPKRKSHKKQKKQNKKKKKKERTGAIGKQDL